jgi:hypothetical protein
VQIIHLCCAAGPVDRPADPAGSVFAIGNSSPASERDKVDQSSSWPVIVAALVAAAR